MVIRLTLCALAVLGLSILLPVIAPTEPAPFYAEKTRAARLAAEAREAVGERLLGVEYSAITTTAGHRDAKLLSMAPDFPALLVEWLRETGIGDGDAVAINASGSFPALTIASIAAVKAVGARPLMITSLGASSWGANRPEYTWAQMELELRQRWPEYTSIGMSPGGDGDEALDLLPEGREALVRALRASGVPEIAADGGTDAVTDRMRFWQQANAGRLPAILINIGGNQAFWGTGDRGETRREGLWLPGSSPVVGDGVGDRFLAAGKPVIHLLGVKKLAARYGITIPPDPDAPLWRTSTPPPVARCGIFLFLLAVMAALPRIIRGKP